MTDEISNNEEKQKISRIEHIELPSKICTKACRICSSDYVKEIHLMRNDGAEFQKIVDYLQEKYNFKTSCGSLSNHFGNYREIKSRVSAELIKNDLIEEATELARHTKAVVSLLDKYLSDLKTKTDAGHYKVNVADLEKLFNIRHKILAGESGGEKDLIALFQRAQSEQGVDLNQGILWKQDAI